MKYGELPRTDPRRFMYELDRLAYMAVQFSQDWCGPRWSDVWRPENEETRKLQERTIAEALFEFRCVAGKIFDRLAQEEKAAFREIWPQDDTRPL